MFGSVTRNSGYLLIEISFILALLGTRKCPVSALEPKLVATPVLNLYNDIREHGRERYFRNHHAVMYKLFGALHPSPDMMYICYLIVRSMLPNLITNFEFGEINISSPPLLRLHSLSFFFCNNKASSIEYRSVLYKE